MKKKAKPTSRKRTPTKVGIEGLAPVKPPKRSLNLHEWLEDIRAHSETAAASGALKGACLVPNPQTGGNDCIRTDEATCSRLGGTWLGGPCGPD
jgi:hypothetical protein